MSRPTVRSVMLDHDTINQIKNLFGHIRNAHRLLGLQLDVPYQSFYRALQFQTILPAHKTAILERWEAWRMYYLRPECPLTDDMSLNPMDHTLEPEWLNKPKKTKSESSTRSGPSSSGSPRRR